MTRIRIWILLAAALFCPTAADAQAEKAGTGQGGKATPIEWKRALRQPMGWYGGAEAVRIAENVLVYQHDNGGWDKNIDMASVLGDKERAAIVQAKGTAHTTIDNDATYTQMEYLARVFNATHQDRFKAGFIRGLDYLFAAQYENGGWPQFYPLRKGYWSHITFNDDAMIGVMTVLRDIARKETAYAFVDEARRVQAEKAVSKGIDCILKCQVVVDGKPTAWCAQHDERTLAPAPGRAYELVSLSGAESVGIVRFLMGIERPGPDVVRAIDGAVAWFEAAKLTGMKVVLKEDKSAPKGVDKVVVPDPAAPPLWARFYAIGTNGPIFSDRDGIARDRLADIGYERRNGYAWLGDWPEPLLKRDYPAWKARIAAR